ncbi:uncharacterized protein LOC103962612 [Pyrus x bretschneideri]|uniref:uncharacterized protein LOC103962612 n=1 Tax=Pyrus x bretschneideri TaxID=225117 RepID=UPI00202E6709|nr:uncharacterized protein LOC103962612 [Pyrus x bretschneideri]
MSFFPSNSQIQTQNADSRFQATVLVGAPSFPDAIAWSDENLIAVASGHLVTILNPAALPFGPRGLITIKNSQPFPIGVIDRQDLFSNCMLPTILSRDQEPCVRSISWSPVGLAPNAGCLLAVCTTQGFVKLYRSPYCDFCAEWIEVANVSAKLYDYLVSINFGEVRASSSKQQDVNEHEIEPEIDYDPSKQKSSNKIVRASKSKVKPAKEIPVNSTLPLITADQYASRTAMLTSLVVAWSPMLHSPSKICSVPQDGSSMSLLAVGAKSGKVSVWRIPVPECYSVDQSRVPATVALIGILQAHNSWITAIGWALLDSDSSNPKVLLATASTDGSVRIWLGNNEKLLKSSEPSDTSFSLMKEVASNAAPVFVLSVIVPIKSPDKIHLAVGKGSGSFELWICNMSSQKFDKIGTYVAHGQTVTGLAWAFDGQSLYSCSQDNVIRCWILSGSSLCEVPIPSNTPRLRNSTDLPEEFVSCFGLAVSPGNLVIAWVRNTDVEQLNPMYEARTQKAIVEFFWTGGQQVDVFSNNSVHFDTEAIPGFSEELVYWESNFQWSLKQYEMQDKHLVVWDIVTALLAFNHSKPEFVEQVLIKWLSISYLGSHVGISAETVLLNVSRSCSKVTSRQLHLLNIICRRVILSEMKADEINSKLLNLKGVHGAEKEKRSLWINLLLNSEKELRERLVGFTFSALLSQMPASAPDSPSRNWFPVGLAQMEQWIELNHDHVHSQLKVLASEVGKRDRRFGSSKCIAAEMCSYCLASVPFESPEVAFCSGKGHKLVRCSISMEICPTTPTWFCTCCHRRASKSAPATLFATPGLPLNFKSLAASPLLELSLKPLCPFCGILLQRLQPDFLLSASPT